MNPQKLLNKIINNPKNVRFRDMIILVEKFGFVHDRTKGSHHIFVHPDIPDLLNLQNSNGEVKPYQIKQFLSLVEQYNLSLQED